MDDIDYHIDTPVPFIDKWQDEETYIEPNTQCFGCIYEMECERKNNIVNDCGTYIKTSEV